jgi:hypothetical protein
MLKRSIRFGQEHGSYGTTLGHVHFNRSRHFVQGLTLEFRKLYQTETGYAVFSGRDLENRGSFNRNEFLYDLAVCEIDTVPSTSWGAGLHFVKRAIWVIESEFAPNRRAVLADFSKLVIAAAGRRLFVCSRTKNEEAFIEHLGYPAAFCPGEVMVAVLPHPSRWDDSEALVSLREWKSSAWCALSVSADG